MKKLISVLALLSIPHLVSAEQPSQVLVCAGCHGQDGISIVPIYPNLAGQKEQYLLLQLKKFKSGERPDPVMKGMTAGLNDEDMAALAAYYANLK